MVEQELGSEMFIIVHGLVHVIFGGNAIAILKDGDVFGEQSLITKSKRNASVRAITYCDTLVLRKDGFDEVMASYPDFFISLQRLGTGANTICISLASLKIHSYPIMVLPLFDLYFSTISCW